MSKRKKIAFGCAVALITLFAAASGAIWKMDRDHGWWHDCRQNCWLIDDAKRICAEKRGLADGTMVTWQDIQPFLTNSVYWASQPPFSSGPPKCPAGGTYTLNPVGSWSRCSVPYHQWNNCKGKEGTPWRQ